MELREQVARVIGGVDDPKYIWADATVRQYWLTRADKAIVLIKADGDKGDKIRRRDDQ